MSKCGQREEVGGRAGDGCGNAAFRGRREAWEQAVKEAIALIAVEVQLSPVPDYTMHEYAIVVEACDVCPDCGDALEEPESDRCTVCAQERQAEDDLFSRLMVGEMRGMLRTGSWREP